MYRYKSPVTVGILHVANKECTYYMYMYIYIYIYSNSRLGIEKVRLD